MWGDEGLVDREGEVADVFNEEVVELFEGCENIREGFGDGGEEVQKTLAEGE